MKPLGELIVYTGPLLSAKSTALIKEYVYRNVFDKETAGHCRLYYPAADERWQPGRVETHNGNGVAAEPIERLPKIPQDVHTLFFDEIHFLDPMIIEGDFIEYVSKARLAGINFICAGLNLDYAGRPFTVTAGIMAMATKVHRLEAQCSLCAAPATHSALISMNSNGQTDDYAPMCANHWHEHMLAPHVDQ